ncbi:MAG: glycyl-radical enzyme activating protein [Candidatus Omnitrophota bacterium]|nr:glycyl-radical enzyme activating protein [Candidatus Omnitrophota bacterium]
MSAKGFITRVQKFSLHDGPGIRTTIFLKGCPLNCVWCHNPENIPRFSEVLFLRERCAGCRRCVELCSKKCFDWQDKIVFKSDDCDRCGLCVNNCSLKALLWSGMELPAEEIIHQALSDKSYYEMSGGGVTISGGEPLFQIDFSCELASLAEKNGINVALDTSGYSEPEAFMKILPFVDLFLFDLKFIDPELHEKYTGRSNGCILDNFRRLHEAKKHVSVRVPLIPKVTDTPGNLAQIHEFVRSVDPVIDIIHIPFNVLMPEKYGMLGKTNLKYETF